MLTHENLLASRVVCGVSGLLSMCIWNLWLFLRMQLGFHCPLHVMTLILGLTLKLVQGIRPYSEWIGKSVSLFDCGTTHEGFSWVSM